MIDIHCHILPGIDDGPDDLDETLEMCRLSLAGGVKAVIATPHMYQEMFRTDKSSILHAYEQVREALTANSIPLVLYIGADLHLVPGLEKKIEAKEALTLNHGSYFLLEPPFRVLPPNLNQVVFNLVSSGLVPIITHPERNEVMIRREELLLDLLRHGALCQVTAMSLTGEFGQACQTFACRLVEAGAVHFIASDAHSTGWRGPGFGSALDVAEELIGKTAAARLVRENPEAVLSGGKVETTEVKGLPKRKRFWLF